MPCSGCPVSNACHSTTPTIHCLCPAASARLMGGAHMLKTIVRLSLVAGGLTAFNLSASTLFLANLDGPQEPTSSTATGFGTVVLNDAMDTITVDLSWTG